ncbi:hydroxyisourate hydrolase [Arthrobacter citreus]|uniref:hydroxyisourate hydrolase n=1 Tax=Arthrobacter citreus TaxID=1670 RepID=UPI00380244C4
MTSRITTHVLDTSTGRPAPGIPVSLQIRGDLDWEELGTGTTDADGRIPDLGPQDLPSGSYRLEFATETYFAAAGTPSFFPSVTVTFTVAEQERYHVPLLISPFAYSTYRGS